MKKRCLSFLIISVILTLVFSGCHFRRVSDIKPSMTKEEVISQWGKTDLITYEATDGTTRETWEYHFATSGSICKITFIQDRVTTTVCHPMAEEKYYSVSEWYPEPYYYLGFYYPSYLSFYYGFYYPRPYYYPPYHFHHRPPHRHHPHRK